MKKPCLAISLLMFIFLSFFAPQPSQSKNNNIQEYKAKKLISNAIAFREIGDNETAEKIYFEAIKTLNNGTVWTELANFYYETAQKRKALKVTTKIKDSFPEHSDTVAQIHNSLVKELDLVGLVPLIEIEQIKVALPPKAALYSKFSDLLSKQEEKVHRDGVIDNTLNDELVDVMQKLQHTISNESPVPALYNTLDRVAEAHGNAGRVAKDNGLIAKAKKEYSTASICQSFAFKVLVESSLEYDKTPYKKTNIPDRMCFDPTSPKSIANAALLMAESEIVTNSPSVSRKKAEPKNTTSEMKSAPTYSSNRYNGNITRACKDIVEAGGGSYVVEKGCRDMENDAKQKLSRMTIPSRIFRPCKELADVGGGSYVVMVGCVEMELEAKAQL